MNRPLLLGGMAFGVLLLYATMQAGQGGLDAARVDSLLTAQYGGLPAGLRWRDVVWSADAERLGLLNLPDARQASNLQRLVSEVLAPASNLVDGDWIVRQGFTTPAVARSMGRPCRLGGHDTGQALDVRLLGFEDPQTLGLLRTAGGPFQRAVLADGHVHVELGNAATPARRCLVQLPSGLVVPSTLV